MGKGFKTFSLFPHMQDLFFNSSLGRIHYYYREGKYPILFIHGIGGNSKTWMKTVKFIGDYFSLYLIDLLGHGSSDKPHIEYTVDLNSEILNEFIISLGIENFGIAGNSYGGWVTLRYSLKFKKPEYIVLEDSAGLNTPIGKMDMEIKNSFIESLVSSGNCRYVMENMIKNNAEMKYRINEDDLKKIRSKTLIIWGDNDNVIPIEFAFKFKKFIQCSRLKIIEGAGHLPHLEKPEEFAKILQDSILDNEWIC
jgi:pimeloyl-ACP methyl ester carboxylesterase